jgi:hypothetical protein
MPRITIEYGDDEQSEAREAMEASRLACALREIDEECRMWIKHGETSEQERKRLEAIRGWVPEFVREC